VFTALPHGKAAERAPEIAESADKWIDLSADFRLCDAENYAHHYGAPHPCPERLGDFVYGLPEHHPEAIRSARFVSGVGCNATAVNLGLLPLQRAGLLSTVRAAVADVKAGSSEAGRVPAETSHHPERRGVMRSYAPAGHRHGAEIEQAHAGLALHLSVTSVETVRGVLATIHVLLEEAPSEKELWRIWRDAVSEEPFLRIVHERRGGYRHPEPRLLAGTNFADIGFARDPRGQRLVALCAIDNLGKGAAANAIQCMNLMCGLPESEGLTFAGIHPW